MLAELDAQVALSPGDFSVRPHLLLLTGDQIYADDVALPMLRTVNETAKALLGWSERYGLEEADMVELVGKVDLTVAAVESAARSVHFRRIRRLRRRQPWPAGATPIWWPNSSPSVTHSSR